MKTSRGEDLGKKGDDGGRPGRGHHRSQAGPGRPLASAFRRWTQTPLAVPEISEPPQDTATQDTATHKPSHRKRERQCPTREIALQAELVIPRPRPPRQLVTIKSTDGLRFHQALLVQVKCAASQPLQVLGARPSGSTSLAGMSVPVPLVGANASPNTISRALKRASLPTFLGLHCLPHEHHQIWGHGVDCSMGRAVCTLHNRRARHRTSPA